MMKQRTEITLSINMIVMFNDFEIWQTLSTGYKYGNQSVNTILTKFIVM